MSLPYHFDDSRRAFCTDPRHVPAPWINYLSNGTLHAFVSQAGGGCLWWKSPLSFRITRYRMQNLPIDTPGFYLYLREADGAIWSPTLRPCDDTPVDQRTSEHRPGLSTFSARRGPITATMSLFIPPGQEVLVWDIALTNHGPTEHPLDLFGYAELGMLDWKQDTDWEYYVRHNLHVGFDEAAGAVTYLYHHHYHPRLQEAPLVWFASTLPVKGYCGDRDVFVGNYGDERRPAAVRAGKLGNEAIACGEPCAALHNAVTIAPGQTLRLAYLLGTTPRALPQWPASVERTRKTITALRQPGMIDQLRREVDRWWEEHLNVLQAQIPDADCARMMNLWNPVQSVHTGRYSRSFSSQASGVRGMGFRDTCQDMLAVAYRKPQWATDIFLYLLTQQLPDGRTVHECFPGEHRRPDPAIHIDDPLWLPMLAHGIIAETGDLSLLEKSVPWLSADGTPTTHSSSVWEHLLGVVRFVEEHLGEHGLPLILHGDWNDSIRKFATAARGESTFAAQQYVHVLNLLIPMAEARGDDKAVQRLGGLRAKQIKAIVSTSWDGSWWRRGYDRDGAPIGSRSCKYGQIWINSQTWAVIAAVGTSEQNRSALQATFDILNTDYGLKKLHPSFATYPDEPDAYSGYSPGCGENGAIFCHANTWAIIAEALLGNADRAWQYYRQLVPHLAIQKAGVQRYQAEPYAYVSNIIGPENPKFGWANVTQVTGTAAWMDLAGTQYLLGLRPEVAGIKIDPCIPAEWDGFTAQRVFRGCRLNIQVKNPQHVAKGVKSLRLGGQELDLTQAGPLLPARLLAGKEAAVQVVMG